jgi:hypothetical protein
VAHKQQTRNESVRRIGNDAFTKHDGKHRRCEIAAHSESMSPVMQRSAGANLATGRRVP